MRRFSSITNITLGLLALGEHGAVLWWGAVWPWSHVARYPGDGGMNDYLILATCLLVGASFVGATAFRGVMPRRAWLLALTLTLPCGVGALAAVVNSTFLDPVVYYLALVPGILAALAPYAFLSRLAPLRLTGSRS